MTEEPKPLYSITTYTGHGPNDGTSSPVYVTLYDSLGKKIGDEIGFLYADMEFPFPFNRFNRLSGGVQEEKRTPPLWGHIEKDGFPLPAVIKVRIGGSDFWYCHKITVKRFNDPKGRNDQTAVFQIDVAFSTDGSEGTSQVFVKNSNFEITETVLNEKTQTSSGFFFFNNGGGEIIGEPLSQTVTVIDAQSISTTEERGNEETNSLKIGIKQSGGFDFKGATGDSEISVEYERTWKEWSSRSNTRAYMGTEQRSRTIKVGNIPAKTLRIYKLYGSYKMRTIRMTNGLAEPTDFNVLLDNSLSINLAAMETIDINADNKKTRREWYELKSEMLNSNSGITADALERAEQTITKNGWFVEGTPINYNDVVGIFSEDGRIRLDIGLRAMKEEIPASHDSLATRLVIRNIDNPQKEGSVSYHDVVGIFSVNGKARLDIGLRAMKEEIPASHDSFATRLVIRNIDNPQKEGSVSYHDVVGIFSEDGRIRLDIGLRAMKEEIPASHDSFATRLFISQL